MRELLDTAEHTLPYDRCRCERGLVCASCLHLPEDCDCSNALDDLADEFDPDDPGTDDPLARVLLGLPSGLHCHCDGRCMSGHCEGAPDA